MGRKYISDKQLLIDLFQASKPRFDEHRLAFTIRFSPRESSRIKKKGSQCYTEALRTVKRILKNGSDKSPAIDIVLTLERNRKPYSGLQPNIYGVHAHGWIRAKKSFTADDLDDKFNNTRSKAIVDSRASSSTNYNPLWNYDYEDLYQYENGFIPAKSTVSEPFVFDLSTHPVDSGWVAYMSKEFDENPIWRRKAVHKFAATRNTKSMATKIRKNRSKAMDDLVRWMHEDTIENWRDMRRMR